MEMLQEMLTPDFFITVMKNTAPILFAALGGLITRRAGILNMALEGMMLWAALVGALVSGFSREWFPGAPDVLFLLLGMVAGIAVGVLVSAMLAFFSLKLKANNILVGIGLNTMASGGTVYLMYVLLNKEVSTTSRVASSQFPVINIPGIENIPVLNLLTGHNLMVWLSIIAVIVTYFLIFRTALGLRIRAVGENPDAAESVGIKVNSIKTTALLLSGFVTSFGGMYYSMGLLSVFSRDMTAGRGFIALAAMNLGNANPLATTLASLLFGFSDSIGIKLVTAGQNPDLVKAMPYFITLLALVLYSIARARKLNKLKAAR